MFVAKKDNIPQIQPYPKLTRKLGTINEEGWVEIDGVRLRKDKDIAFQSGFQEAIQTCEADLIFTGGTASAGKTFGILMEALRGLGKANYSALIVKKELVEVDTAGGILSDAKRIYKEMRGCEFSKADFAFRWEEWNSSIMLSHINLQGESQEKEAQEKMKNKQASYTAVDELTNFTFKVWNYLFSRNRDSSGMRPKMICTMNANGWHFSRTMLGMAGYIGEDNYVIPEMVGVIKYFVSQGENPEDIVWADSKEDMLTKIPDLESQLTPEMRRDGLTVENLMKTFTFIPGNIMDNRILTYQTQGGNVANLFNIGTSERLKLLYGYWGETAEGEAMVTNKQIYNMFPGENQNAIYGNEQRYMTVDIGGGNDQTLALIWKGLSVIAQHHTYTADAKEKEQWIRGLKNEYDIPIQNIAVDANGLGDYLDSYMQGVIGIVPRRAPMTEYDEAGNKIEFERYVSLKDQLCARLSAYINTGKIRFELDGDAQYVYGRKGAKMPLKDIVNIQATELLKMLKNDRGKYYFPSKRPFVKRHGYSPDLLDCMIFRMIFELRTILKKEGDPIYTDEDYYKAFSNW